MSKQVKAIGTPLEDAHMSCRDSADIVIVGNGIAGLTAAVEARGLAPEKQIVIIAEQSHPTINTPALKHFAIGKLTREQLLAYPPGTERSQHIRIINARVEEIKTQGKCVYLSDGQEFGYGSLLLATGSAPVGLPAHLPGRDFDGVLTLHRLKDYLDLRRRLREVKEAAIIGGGIHAMETVMSLLHCGIRVRWLIRGETILPRMLDRSASSILLEYCQRAKASVHTETEVVGIVGRVGAVAGVVTNHDQMLPCQIVLACTGTVPMMALAERSGVLKSQQGILVDDQLRTSVRDIYAAGDVAALENPQTGAYQRRAQWHAAVLQGRVAAAMMTDHAELASPFGVPWHATPAGKLSLLSLGDPLGETEGTTVLTDSSKKGYRRMVICDDRLVGYLSLGASQPDSLAIKRIIDEGLSIEDIQKALLEGEFDERRYFSQRRSHGVHTMVTTGKLAVTNLLVPSSLRANAPRNTEPLLATLRIDEKSGVKHSDVSPHNAFGSVHTTLNETITNKDIKGVEQQAPVINSFKMEKRHLFAAEPAVEQQSPVINSFKSLMNKRFEPVKWIVPEILPEGLIALAGKQNIGKSWLDLVLGLGVARGGTVLGSIKVKQGNVLYLALEDNERCLQERLGKLLTSGAAIPGDFEYATKWPRMDADGLAALGAWLVSHPNARLIIIDPWTKVKPTGKQKATHARYEADYEALIGLKQLAVTYKVCILVQFHVRKAVADPFDELKATTGIACADGFLNLRRAYGEDRATLCGTGREYVQDVDLALSFNDGSWKISGKTASGALSIERKAIIDVLHASDKPMKPKEIALVLGKLDGTVRKMLYDMKASALVKQTEQGYVSLIPQDDLPRNRNRGNDDNRSNKGNESNGSKSVEHFIMQELSARDDNSLVTEGLYVSIT